MNLRSKWCVYGLLSWAAMAGIANAQPAPGSVRLGAPSAEQLPPPLTSLNDGTGQMNLGGGGMGYTTVQRQFRPRVNIDTRGGGLYGYNPGYTNIGLFLPYDTGVDSQVLFLDARGMVTHDGGGGANIGVGWRQWIGDIDRVVGISGWYDNDGGHSKTYNQFGVSFESLGRYLDYRVNGYIPVGTRSNPISSTVDPNSISFSVNDLLFRRTNVAEQTYSGFDAELGGPLPVIGRYGVNGYVGGYYFKGNGDVGGSVTGVSSRFMAQVNEDLSFGMQFTNDHVFGANAQFQIFVTVPDGAPSRWLRNPRVQDRLTESVYRQYRVMAHTDTFFTTDQAINPKDHLPYFVTHVDPNASTGGDGTFENPFQSIGLYNGQTLAAQQNSDIIYVRPSTNPANAGNLDTGTTLAGLTLFDGQRLLSSSVSHTFQTDNFPLLPAQTLPGQTTGLLPELYNGLGGDVITLAPNANACIEVSGFDITGSATGNGIVGTDNTFVLINRNNIHDALNGVFLTNLTGTGNMASLINENIFDNNDVDGVNIANTGAAPLELILHGNTASNNGDDGVDLSADAGSAILVDIDAIGAAPSTITPSAFTDNGDNGLELTATAASFIGGRIEESQFNSNDGDGVHITADASTIDFQDALLGSEITNNDFNTNTGSGMEVVATNGSTLLFDINANRFGDSAVPAGGNADDGLRISADGGVTDLIIGGDTAADGNVFVANLENGVVLNLTGNSINTLDVGFNTITLGAGGGGNIFLTGHDIDDHVGQNDFDTIILDYLRGAGTPNAIAADQYSLALIGTGPLANSVFSFTGGVKVKPGYESTNYFDTDDLTANPALWDQVFANDGIIILSDSSTGADLDGVTGVAAVNSQAARFATAISSGTDVWANSGGTNANYYNFLPAGVVASGAALANNSFLPTAAGTAIGIIDTTPGSMINGFPTHNAFTGIDPAFTVYETTDPLTGPFQDVSIGVQNAVIGAGGFVRPGTDAIRINIEDTAIVTTADIHDNTTGGYGANGIHIVSNDTSEFQDLTIQRNTTTGSGNGIGIERHDASLLNAVINNNTGTSNALDGLNVLATGDALPNVTLTLFDNTYSGNTGDGMSFNAAGDAIVNMQSDRDTVINNRGNGISFSTDDNAQMFSTLRNITATGNTFNGLEATISGNSTFDLAISSPVDPLFTAGTGSVFTGNSLNGMQYNTNDTSLMLVNIDNVTIDNNVTDGIGFNRLGASLLQVDINNTSISNNQNDGLSFRGLGSDPQDPIQQLSGTPNRINLTDVNVDNNGTGASGNGVRVDLLGDSELVLNATRSTFRDNAENGVRVYSTPGAQFGYTQGAERSTFDGVTVTGNGGNGFFITSDISATPVTDPNSLTYMEINSNSGNTLIADNTLNGVLLQFPGGFHDILITGDSNPAAPVFTTRIRENGQDGIHVDTGLFATTNLSLDDVIVGGPLAANGNGGDGIDFEVVSQFRVVDGANTQDFPFNAAGTGNLFVNNTTIQNNGGHGLNLVGNNLNAVGIGNTPTQNSDGDPNGFLNATVINSRIEDNVQNGVNIDLQGAMGFRGLENSLVFDNNVIRSNGQHGFFMQQNPATQFRGGNTFRRIEFFDPQPTNPVAPFNPTNLAGTSDWNTGNNTSIQTGFYLSNYMNLRTDLNTSLVFTNNVVQFNGTSGVLNTGDGVYIRIGTNSYLSADIQGNTISGNLGNDLHIESFNAFNPATNAAIIPPASTAGTAPAPDVVFLDDTAQLDLRLVGNTGNSVNFVDPFNNFGGGLPGNTTPNGAFYPGDFFKNNFGTNVQPRLVQLFQVDDAANLNANNDFTQNGNTANLQNLLFNAEYHLRTDPADPLFPSPLFPEDFFTDPGDPFLQ